MILDYKSHMVRVGNLLLVPTSLKHGPTPGRSLGEQRQTGSTIALVHLIPPPSQQLWSRGKRIQPGGYIASLAYWAHK
jgi:hypothetical protein